jgi:hypothetical protein
VARQEEVAPAYGAALRPLAYGALGFFSSVVVCLYIAHDATVEHDGISYFSVRATTLPVIVCGYVAVAAGMLCAANRFPDDELGRRLALPLRCFPAFFALLLLTPFNRGTALNWTHMTVGVTLAISQALVTAWLCTVLPAVRVLASAALELAGGLVAACSLPGTGFNYLFAGELIFNVGFCLCLLAVVHDAAAASSPEVLGRFAED